MKLRILTAMIGAVIFLASILLGGFVFRIVMILLALGASFELKRAFSHLYRLDMMLSAILVTSAFFLRMDMVLALLFLYALLTLCTHMFTQVFNLSQALSLIFSMLYTLIPFLLLYRQIAFSEDVKPLLIFLIAWGTDTFAYFTGMFLGRHPMSRWSPKKTWEGSIGGIVGAMVLVGLSLIWIDVKSMAILFVFTLIASVASQLSDLVASYIKRNQSIKDFGRILPGHGGILDRFDSLITIICLYTLFLPWL